MPYSELPGFVSELAERPGIAAPALQFTILTAARTGEVTGAQWSEIDFNARSWTVPAERMKGGRKHQVPLSDRAIELLRALPTEDGSGFVFIGPQAGSGLSGMAMTSVLRRMGHGDVTTHGFRSSFRDWAADRTSFPRDVAEMALAHAIPNAVEAAYRRGDLLVKRKQLAEAWSKFCTSPPATGATVVALREGARA
jgi:integrase